MYKIPRYLGITIIVAIFALVSYWPSVTLAAEKNHKPITKELMALLDKNPDIRAMLSSSIAKWSERSGRRLQAGEEQPWTFTLTFSRASGSRIRS